MICVVFMAGIPAGFANHFASIGSWSVTTAAIFIVFPFHHHAPRCFHFHSITASLAVASF
jgi:hypothetical protein